MRFKRSSSATAVVALSALAVGMTAASASAMSYSQCGNDYFEVFSYGTVSSGPFTNCFANSGQMWFSLSTLSNTSGISTGNNAGHVWMQSLQSGATSNFYVNKYSNYGPWSWASSESVTSIKIY